MHVFLMSISYTPNGPKVVENVFRGYRLGKDKIKLYKPGGGFFGTIMNGDIMNCFYNGKINNDTTEYYYNYKVFCYSFQKSLAKELVKKALLLQVISNLNIDEQTKNNIKQII